MRRASLCRVGCGLLASFLLLACGGGGSKDQDLCAGVTCAALDPCHAVGTCDPATGACTNPAKPDGVTCDDGNRCTQSDTCRAGACAPGPIRRCLALDQCHAAGTCDPATGNCSNPARPDGTSCDDANGCTLADSCLAGACAGGATRACPANGPCQEAGFCDPASGACSNPAKPDKEPCDDGSLCTSSDVCLSGVCVGSALACPTAPACHAPGACDPRTGTCSDPFPADGSWCAFGDQGGVCFAGACGPAEGFEGSFHGYGLSTGPRWSGWSLAEMAFDRGGVVQAFRADYSDGTSTTTPPAMDIQVDAAGHMTVPLFPSYWGTFSAGGGEAVASLVDADGSATLTILLRKASSLAKTDLAGDWFLHVLTVSSGFSRDARWARGTASVAGNGATTRRLVDPDGAAGTESFAAEVAPSGEVERVYPFLTAGRGGAALSPAGQVLVGVWTTLDGGASLEMAVRAGSGYGQADLVGDWDFHLLSAADAAAARDAAAHGVFSVDGAGAVDVLYQVWTAAGLALPGGTVAIDAGGALQHSALPTFAGHLSADRRALVATFGWDGGGAALLVAQKRRGPPVRPVLDGLHAASEAIGETGGSVQAVGADGTSYRLDLPAGAVAPGATVEVTLTPISGLPGLPVNGALLGAVQLSPDGLELLRPARLEIDPAAGAPSVEAIGFTYPGAGLDRVDFLPAAAGETVSLDLMHFSGAGAAAGTAAAQANPSGAYAGQIAAIVQTQGPGAVAAMEPVFGDWLGAIVEGVRGADSLEGVSDSGGALAQWMELRQRILNDDDTICTTHPSLAVSLKKSLDDQVPVLVEKVERECKAEPTACGKLMHLRRLLRWNANVQLFFGDLCLGVKQTRVCGACGEDADRIPAHPMIGCPPIPTAACSGIAVPIQQSVGLHASILDVCGRDAGASGDNPGGAFPLWRSTQAMVASVDDLGVVRGRDVGRAEVQLGVEGLPCVLPARADVMVYAPQPRPYLLTVTGVTVHYEGRLGCPSSLKQVPAPVVRKMEIDADLSVHFGENNAAFCYDEGTQSGLDDQLFGSVARFRTYQCADDWDRWCVGALGHCLLFRDYRLQGSTRGMTGYYDWTWLQYYGCGGRNEVTLTPLP